MPKLQQEKLNNTDEIVLSLTEQEASVLAGIIEAANIPVKVLETVHSIIIKYRKAVDARNAPRDNSTSS